jgi:hypothetical protein
MANHSYIIYYPSDQTVAINFMDSRKDIVLVNTSSQILSFPFGDVSLAKETVVTAMAGLNEPGVAKGPVA